MKGDVQEKIGFAQKSSWLSVLAVSVVIGVLSMLACLRLEIIDRGDIGAMFVVVAGLSLVIQTMVGHLSTGHEP